MQMHNGSAALLRARSPRLYVTLRRLLQGATRQPTWGPRKPWPTEHIGAYPIRSTEKLRFADTDRHGRHLAFTLLVDLRRLHLARRRG